MINQTQQTIFRLNNLNDEQRRISYQMSTGKILENGSDDANLYARELYVDDKIRTYEGIKLQITKTTNQNNVSDSAISEIKKMIEFIQVEAIKANTSTTTDDGRKAIATGIDGVKENIFDLVNTQVEGEYVFAGSDSSVTPFSKDPTSGKIVYNGDNSLRRVTVEEGSFRERGINGIELMTYQTDVANSDDTVLSFDENETLIDQDGFLWKLNAAGTNIEKYDFDDNPTGVTLLANETLPSTTPKTYSVDLLDATNLTTLGGSLDGKSFEARTSIFDDIDKLVNALNKVDSDGNPISGAEAVDEISAGIERITNSFDAVNLAHADLGSKNKIFEIQLERVSSKLTQFNILSTEIGSADLGKVAMEAKALELTYTALYSTINRTNELSLVNFLR